MATFNPRNWESWFFGPMSRQEATSILKYRPTGEFIVRESNRVVGDYVLSVKEEHRICHYIINKITTTELTFNFGQDINMFPAQHGSHPLTGLQESKAFLNEQTSYKIGAKVFANLPSLLDYYTYHFLDTAYLTQPVPKRAVIEAMREVKGFFFEQDNKGFLPELEDTLFGKESSVAVEKESFFDREKYREHSKHEDKGSLFDQERVFAPPRPVENGFYFNQQNHRVESARVAKAFAPFVDNQSSFDEEKCTVEHRDKNGVEHREKDGVEHRERDRFEHRERDGVEHRERDRFEHREKNGVEHRERDRFEHRERDGVDHRERDRVENRERNGVEHRERDGVEHRERKGVEHRERERDGVEHRERNGVEHRERNGVEHRKRERDGVEHRERDRVEHGEREFVPNSVGKVVGIEKVIAKYDFAGRDPDDLPFRKHEILLIVLKHEVEWWTAMNVKRQCGLIPANYVKPFKEGVPSQPSIASQVPSQPSIARQSSDYLNLRS